MNKIIPLALFSCLSCSAALTANITSVGQQQAILQIQGFNATCSLVLSTSNSLTPVHPDVNGTEYAGSNTDTGRADTITSQFGQTRLVTLGHPTDDRSLAASTLYFYQVSGCGGTASGSFTTANISSGITRSEAPPFNPARWGNLAYPPIDYTNISTWRGVDPMSGLSYSLMPWAISWRQGPANNSAGGTCGTSCQVFADWSSTDTCTNCSTIVNGSTGNAILDGTGVVDLYMHMPGFPEPSPYDGIFSDIGVTVYGAGSSGTPIDRQVDLCIFLHPANGCASNIVTVQLGTGSVVHVASGSSDPDGAFPATYPIGGFISWFGGTSIKLHQENMESYGGANTAVGIFGGANINGSTLTLNDAYLGAGDHFSDQLISGDRIFLANLSGGCPGANQSSANLCTISSMTNTVGASVQETPTGVATSVLGTITGTSGFLGTSATSNTIGTGAFTFTLAGTCGSWVATTPIMVASRTAGGHWMFGTVTSCTGSTLIINATASNGSGAHSDWNVDSNNVLTVNTSTGLATNDTLSIAGAAGGGAFSATICANPATNVYLLGFNNCTNQYNATTTVSSAVTTIYTSFRSYGWGVRVQKHNTNGTVTVGFQYKPAGPMGNIGVTSGEPSCQQILTGPDLNGEFGYQCFIGGESSGVAYEAFVTQSGKIRYWDNLPNVSFDDKIAGRFYQQAKVSGGWTVLQFDYNGDWTTNLLPNAYLGSASGNIPSFTPSITPTNGTNLMPHGVGAGQGDLDQQIQLAQGVTLPAYNTARYGAWTQANGNVAAHHCSGHICQWDNLTANGIQSNPTSGGPGWVTWVDTSTYQAGVSPATVINLASSLTGAGIPSWRFGGLHAADMIPSLPNVMNWGWDPLNSASSGAPEGGPWQSQVVGVLRGGVFDSNTCLTWPLGTAGTSGCAAPQQTWDTGCDATSITFPNTTIPYGTCITLEINDNICNTHPSAIEIAEDLTCPWNPAYTEYPAATIQPGDAVFDMQQAIGVQGSNFNSGNEIMRVLTVTSLGGGLLRINAVRNGPYEYCSSGTQQWQGFGPTPNPQGQQNNTQLYHANNWVFTMSPGQAVGCFGSVGFYSPVTGQTTELGRNWSLHGSYGQGIGTNINILNSAQSIWNQPITSIGAVPYTTTNTLGTPSFHGNNAQIGASGVNSPQSYINDDHFAGTVYASKWGVDSNPFLTTNGFESLGSGPIRSVTSTSNPNIWIVQNVSIGITLSKLTYKVQPIVAWAGRYVLLDVSGPSATSISALASTPFSVCYTYLAGECFAGSSANAYYVNVPHMYDPGYCTSSLSWANIPCVYQGYNAPGGAIRQFKIDTGYINGAYSRYVGNGLSRFGSAQGFTDAASYPDGSIIYQQSTNYWDGLLRLGLFYSVPPWSENLPAGNDYHQVPVKISTSAAFADVVFGYSNYVGPNANPSAGFYCTPRREACTTDVAQPYTASTLFAFDTVDTKVLTSCTSGCTVYIPALPGKTLYYQVRTSPDGVTWTAYGSIIAAAGS
jgi:hypothetical protein